MATRVLVTGGAGFIGSHLTDALLARGDEVAVIDDLSAGRRGRLPRPAALHQLSITEGAALEAAVRDLRPALIFHLAAQIDVRASVAAPAADAAANVVGTVNVLEAARAAGARLVFCSSGGAVYGQDAPIPSLEDVLLQPESPYGIAKQSAEQYIGLYNRLHGTAHAVLRLSNVYGPRQDPTGESGVIPIFCARILAGQPPVVFGDGRQTRDYVYVKDVVAALLAAADRARPGTWNIGGGREISVLALAGVIGAAAGRPAEPVLAPPRAGELLRSALAIGRAERDLGWRPATPLRAGVQAVLRWIEAGAGDRAAC